MKIHSLSFRDANGRPKALLKIVQSMDALGVRQLIDVRGPTLLALDPRPDEMLVELFGHDLVYSKCHGSDLDRIEALARRMPSAMICACPLRTSTHRALLIKQLSRRGVDVIALDSSPAGCSLGTQRELF